ncbi:TRAP transporter substrate-binding protein [Rhizobium sp. NTR19]|uniref:TRAP transporter substrate-binding protein n=1 Tax=Neorhizobium turbinariae TaxID=2937795 RepID=A0ABT0INI3_9HYPH|nr:TRAP transporter substrate-binding protein [Neorhizobium turbinariae]MCK8779444.1 TRAP transporter substrate-binding protein [Neorhizobium turbinariae]
MKATSTLVALGMAAVAAQAAGAAELRLAHWLPPQHTLQTTGFEPWIKSISDASGGKVTMTIFPAQQLGSATDHYDMARDGIADITFVNPGYQPGRFPIISAGELPFMVTNAKGGSKAFDSWYRAYAEKEMADVHVCMAFVQDPGTIHSREAMRVPGDIKGKNIRPAQATMGSYVNLLGGASVQVPAPEAREVIARGAADAITFPWDSVYLFGVDAVTKHHIDMPLYTTTFVMAMNKASYEGLADDERKVIDDHCTSEWAEKISAGWADQEASGREKALSQKDHTVYKPTAEEMNAWKESAKPLTDKWHEQVKAAGGDSEAIFSAFKSALAAEKALAE